MSEKINSPNESHEPQADYLPESCVTNATGIAGLIGLFLALVFLRSFHLNPLAQSFAVLATPAAAMILWTILIEKAHRNPTTGIDYTLHHPIGESLHRTGIKLLGLWSVWSLIGVVYWKVPFYSNGNYAAFVALVKILLPYFLLLSIFYILWLDRRSPEPHDGAWHMGQFLLGRWQEIEYESLFDFLRSWIIKAFFLAFMCTLLPSAVFSVLSLSLTDLLEDFQALVIWLISLMFLIDICFGTIGYIFESRLLDTHIRSANPFSFGWIAALVCYPPFSLMGQGRWLDYRDEFEWTTWIGDDEFVLIAWGATLVGLCAIYAWATVIFGLRFSNLTNRGIITNGPYRLTKHPAYIAKNMFWWMIHIPFISPSGLVEGLTNSAMLLTVNAIYFLRAKTEEKHLFADPVYQRYANWISSRNQKLILAVRKGNFRQAYFLLKK